MDKEEALRQLVLDKMTKVCLCKSINRLKMKQAIENGAKTVKEVQKATGAGTGPCHGRRCSIKIKELLDKYEANNGSW